MACKCVPCDYCHGSGHLWQTLDGNIHRSRCDDMGDLVNCDYCHGGILEVCDECAEAEYDFE